jgi:hypothetical protein
MFSRWRIIAAATLFVACIFFAGPRLEGNRAMIPICVSVGFVMRFILSRARRQLEKPPSVESGCNEAELDSRES